MYIDSFDFQFHLHIISAVIINQKKFSNKNKKKTMKVKRFILHKHLGYSNNLIKNRVARNSDVSGITKAIFVVKNYHR